MNLEVIEEMSTESAMITIRRILLVKQTLHIKLVIDN